MPLNYFEVEQMDEREFAEFLARVRRAATAVLFAVSESLASLNGKALQAIAAALARDPRYAGVEFIGFNADVGGQLHAEFHMNTTPCVVVLRRGVAPANPKCYFNGNVTKSTLEGVLDTLLNSAWNHGGFEQQPVSAVGA